MLFTLPKNNYFLIMHNTGSDLCDIKGILLSISTYLKDFHLIFTSNMHLFLIINNINKKMSDSKKKNSSYTLAAFSV